jgi:S-adenosylmethionine hydrolase
VTAVATLRFPWITLLTDYGLADGFAAACHGVISRLAPEVQVLDITHLVPPQDIRRGAAVLAQTVPYLPTPAVHVGVVDPGVGTPRRAIALQTASGSVCLGPDNGLLLWAVDELGGVTRAVEVVNPEVALHPVSRTFHGRDVFTPAAARLATGLHLDELGPAVASASLVRMPTPVLDVRDGRVKCEVLTVDQFGNVQTSARLDDLAAAGVEVGSSLSVEPGGVARAVLLGATFAEVPPGEMVALEDSAGRIALTVNRGSAAHRLGLRPGAVIVLHPVM